MDTYTPYYTPLDSGIERAKQRAVYIYENEESLQTGNPLYQDEAAVVEEISKAWMAFSEATEIPGALAELMIEFVGATALLRLYRGIGSLTHEQYLAQFKMAEYMALSWDEVWKKIVEILNPRK